MSQKIQHDNLLRNLNQMGRDIHELKRNATMLSWQVDGSTMTLGSDYSIGVSPNGITGVQIGSNTITAEHIIANTITANEIKANTITANEIKANTITANQIAAKSIIANHIQSNTITANHIAANTITAGQILARSITALEIKTGTLTANEIAAGTITADRITAGTITATQISAGSITGDLIQAGTITANKIAAATITADKISANTITSAQIASATITADRMNVTGGLSSITTNMGSMTAGTITGGTIQSGTTGARWVGDQLGLRGYALDGITKTFEINLGSGIASFTGIANIQSGSIVPSSTLNGILPVTILPDIGGGNFVTNSGFENNLVDWNIWQNEAVISSTQVRYGTKAARLNNTGGLHRDISGIIVGKKYIVSVWVRTTTAATVRPELYVHDGNSGLNPVTVNFSAGQAVDVWKRLSAIFIGTSSGMLRIHIKGDLGWDSSKTGFAYFDGVQIEEGEVPTAYAPKPDEILPGIITNSLIADGAIIADKIGAGAIIAGKIGALAISAGELQADSVTTSKMTVNSINGDRIQVNTLNADKIVSNSIQTLQLAAGAITTNILAAGAVVAGKITVAALDGSGNIAANAVGATQISDSSITTNEILAGTILGTDIAGTTITAANIVSNTITAGQIATGTITAAQIAAGTITADKITVQFGGSNLVPNAKLDHYDGVVGSFQSYPAWVNSITNPSFETDLSGWIGGWGGAAASRQGGGYPATHGTYSVRLLTNAMGTAGQNSFQAQGPEATIVANSWVVIPTQLWSAAADFNIVSRVGNGFVYIQMNFYNSAGTYLSSATGNILTALNAARSVINGAVVPANAARMTFQLIANEGSPNPPTTTIDATADSIMLVKDAAMCPDFFVNTLPSFAYKWGKYDNNPGTGKAVWFKVPGGGPNGENSAKVIFTGNTSTKGYYIFDSPEIPQRANTPYVISFWWKGNVSPTIASNAAFNLDDTWILNPTPSSTTWQRYAKRYKSTVNGLNNTGRDAVYLYSNTSAGTYEITNVQREEGETLTTFGPKPDEVLPGSIGTTLITPGAITTVLLSADAIDGKTITGSLLRTSVSGARIEISNMAPAGLKKYNASGGIAFSIGELDGLIFNSTTGTAPSDQRIQWKDINNEIALDINCSRVVSGTFTYPVTEAITYAGNVNIASAKFGTVQVSSAKKAWIDFYQSVNDSSIDIKCQNVGGESSRRLYDDRGRSNFVQTQDASGYLYKHIIRASNYSYAFNGTQSTTISGIPHYLGGGLTPTYVICTQYSVPANCPPIIYQTFNYTSTTFDVRCWSVIGNFSGTDKFNFIVGSQTIP